MRWTYDLGKIPFKARFLRCRRSNWGDSKLSREEWKDEQWRDQLMKIRELFFWWKLTFAYIHNTKDCFRAWLSDSRRRLRSDGGVSPSADSCYLLCLKGNQWVIIDYCRELSPLLSKCLKYPKLKSKHLRLARVNIDNVVWRGSQFFLSRFQNRVCCSYRSHIKFPHNIRPLHESKYFTTNSSQTACISLSGWQHTNMCSIAKLEFWSLALSFLLHAFALKFCNWNSRFFFGRRVNNFHKMKYDFDRKRYERLFSFPMNDNMEMQAVCCCCVIFIWMDRNKACMGFVTAC